MNLIVPSKRLAEPMALPLIVVLATALAFGSLHAGRRIVQAAGGRAIRAELVQESDQMASQSMAELDERFSRTSTHRPCLAVRLDSSSLRSRFR